VAHALRDSAVSDICKWEADEALKLNKRIVPIVWRPLGEAKPHEHLRGLNYIYFYDEPVVTGSGFGTGLVRHRHADRRCRLDR
jgi:hypothetical protein